MPKPLFSLFVITASQMACLPHRNSLVSIVFNTILSVAAWLLPRIAPVLFYVVFVAAAAAAFVFDLPASPGPPGRPFRTHPRPRHLWIREEAKNTKFRGHS